MPFAFCTREKRWCEFAEPVDGESTKFLQEYARKFNKVIISPILERDINYGETIWNIEQAWYMHPVFSVLIGGILPFGAVFIELFFILTLIWLNKFYYVFGFLFIVFVTLLITCAEITVVLCYF